jgi:hypothetical protein
MAEKTRKQSYVIPCSSGFRDAVLRLAEERSVNAGDIARSVLLVVPVATIAACPDPGEPGPDDREVVVLKSGPNAGRPWRRKPRLQARLPKGYAVEDVRRALGLALAFSTGEVAVGLEDGRAPSSKDRIRMLNTEVSRLRDQLALVQPPPLSRGVDSREEALFVLGYPPTATPSQTEIKTRFRALATVHHPDAPLGDTTRMSQLNQAMTWLRAGAA